MNKDKSCESVIGETPEYVIDWLKGNEAAFQCGPKLKCLNDAEHDYSKWEQNGPTGTAVCSVCGHRAIDDVWWL